MSQRIPHTHLGSTKVGGVEIAYDTFGDAQAPPLLLIADFGRQLISWDAAFCSQLAARGYWVIRFDNRDTGFSTKFDALGVPDIRALDQAQARGHLLPPIYTLNDMADDAIGLLGALDIVSAHIVGFSMGGMIAQIIAIDHPSSVRTLTSIMSTTSDPGLPYPRPEILDFLLTQSPQNRQGYVKHAIYAARQLSGPGFPADEDQVRELEGTAFDRSLDQAGAVRHLAAVITSDSRKEALKSVAAATLVIHGDADVLFPVQCGIATARAIPGSIIQVVEGLGHVFPPDVWPQMIDAIANHAR